MEQSRRELPNDMLGEGVLHFSERNGLLQVQQAVGAGWELLNQLDDVLRAQPNELSVDLLSERCVPS